MTRKQLKELLSFTKNRTIVKFLLHKNDNVLTNEVLSIYRNSIDETDKNVLIYLRNIENKSYVYKNK